MVRKRVSEAEVKEQKEVAPEPEQDQVIPLSRNALLTRIEFIDEFLRNFGSFLSNESLNALNAYKKALQEILEAFERG